jgi:SIR2-like domain
MTAKLSARLDLDALVRSVAVNTNQPMSLLLGAGASISSGMPSAERCIWEWKQDIFGTNNPTLREIVGEISLPASKRRIQSWLDGRGGYPALGVETEYSFYAEACYPTARDRRGFFEKYVKTAQPFLGYKLLPLLIRNDIVRSVWTTNFDGLPARACAAVNVQCVEIGMDTQHRVFAPASRGSLRLVSLHGDYRYDALKNTEAELQEQEAQLRNALVHDIREHDLLVIGYSGRDQSLMTALREAYSAVQAGRLYWCGMQAQPGKEVSELLATAQAKGHEAFYVSMQGFDDLVERLALRILRNEDLEVAKTILAEGRSISSYKARFSVGNGSLTSLVKSNAYPLTTPSEVLKADLRFPEDERPKRWLLGAMAGQQGAWIATPTGGLFLATAADIRQGVGSALLGVPVAVRISPEDIAADPQLFALMRIGLVRSVAQTLGLDQNGRTIWEKNLYERRPLQQGTFALHKALSFRLVNLKGRLHTLLTPEIVAKTLTGEFADQESTKILRNAVYGYQHNHIYDQDIKAWTSRITDKDLLDRGGQTFRIGKVPVYAGLAQAERRPLPGQFQRYATLRGTVLPDAKLVFASASGHAEVKETNPLLGLIKNKPWDYALSSTALAHSTEIAAICPSQFSQALSRFVGSLNNGSQAAATEKDYLQDFPGFSAAFGLALTSSLPTDPAWHNLQVDLNGNELEVAKRIGRSICAGLDRIRSIKPGAITAIFVPGTWASFEIVNQADEHFNLHDSVKAYAARNGQSTQFLREKTVVPNVSCRVKWWLSLALYAKTMRTPWRLECLDEDSAFVGIGYSYDAYAPKTSQILLGCSHIYSARGEGLQFRLGRIENPIIRGRNPYMSLDDARRTGETIRQLFYESRMRLPRRVVIHKRTHFTEEEQQGLSQGLEGVQNIELIEINTEESIRFLASRVEGQNLVIDKFPMPRGAAIVLADNAALVWVHGYAPSVQNPRFKYFQGKRRIPAPLYITRYRGDSDLSQVATEILGLSKMNWNHFDYYSRIPASLDSASAIARVGQYLSHFGAAPYDYRLLI